MSLTSVTCPVRRAVGAAFSTRQWSPIPFAAAASASASPNGTSPSPTQRLNFRSEPFRKVSSSPKTTWSAESPSQLLQDVQRLEKVASIRSAGDEKVDPRVGQVLKLIEQSQEENNTERELEQSLQLYDLLKQREQQDSNVFEVAFGIARIYDEQMEDSAAAVTYYGEALAILKAISTEATVWSAYMRMTALGAFALCHENLGQHEEAEKYFNDAIGAYNAHCDLAVASGASEGEASDSDISLLADLNATVAMIHYHFAGNLLAQERCDEAKNVTEIALVLAENSRMPLEELEKLQHCVHELWLELE